MSIQKIKDSATWNLTKPGVISSAEKGEADPAPWVAPSTVVHDKYTFGDKLHSVMS